MPLKSFFNHRFTPGSSGLTAIFIFQSSPSPSKRACLIGVSPLKIAPGACVDIICMGIFPMGDDRSAAYRSPPKELSVLIWIVRLDEYSLCVSVANLFPTPHGPCAVPHALCAVAGLTLLTHFQVSLSDLPFTCSKILNFVP